MQNIIYTSNSNVVSIYENPWKIYEQTYLGNLDLINYKTINILSKEQIIDDLSSIKYLRNKFYNYNSNYIENYLSNNYLNSYVNKFKNDIEKSILDFFNKGYYNDWIFSFLKLNLYCNCDHIYIISDNIKNELPKNKNEYGNFINKLSGFLTKISKLDKNNNIKKLILNELSYDIYYNIIDKLYEKYDSEFYNQMLNNNKYYNLFKNIIIFNYLKDEHKIKFYFHFLDYLNNLNMNQLLDNSILKNILNIINIFNITYFEMKESMEEIKLYISELKNLENISNYLCASLYYLINDKQFELILECIKFNKFIVDDYYFLKIYNYHLQRRSENKLDSEAEIKIFKYINLVYYKTEYKKQINEIKYTIDDIKISSYLTNEMSEFKINIVSDEFKNVDYDVNKINLLITSNIKWESNKIRNNITTSKDITIYKKILNEYYNLKYSNKRKIEISNDDSFIDIKLGNSYFRMSFVLYNILHLIGINKNETIKTLEEKTKLDENEIEGIIDIFKKYKMIYESDKKLLFNFSTLTSNLNINFTQIKINVKQVEETKKNEKIENYLIDCILVRTCKHSSEKSLSFEILKNELSKKLNNSKDINDNLLFNRLDRLVSLEYITKNNNQEYQYIL